MKTPFASHSMHTMLSSIHAKIDQHLDDMSEQKKGGLSFLLAKVKELKQYNEILEPLLGEALAEHCQVGNFKQGILILVSDSAAWASTLRYQTPSLLQTLRKNAIFANLRSITIKVRPSTNPAD